MLLLCVLNGKDKGRIFNLAKDTVTVGRSPSNDVQIVDPSVSREHLWINKRGRQYFLKDLGS